jgi:hypothetical protein
LNALVFNIVIISTLNLNFIEKKNFFRTIIELAFPSPPMCVDIIRENIEKQLTEIEILKSIYSNLNEFHVEDDEAVVEAQKFIEIKDKPMIFKRKLGFVVKFSIEIDVNNKKDQVNNSLKLLRKKYLNLFLFIKLQLEITVRLPHTYPIESHPEVFVRCTNHNLNRNWYEELSNFIKSSHNLDCSILCIIEWVRDNIEKFVNPHNKQSSPKNFKNNNKSPQSVERKVIFARQWIYSHHIFSSEKRKFIVKLANDLNLTGFSMPGKPGIICTEGNLTNVNEYLSQLKSLNWKKLQSKEITLVDDEDVDDIIEKNSKFKNFEEKQFETKEEPRTFYAFLKENNIEDVFNLYFGVEGSMPTTTIKQFE